MHQADRMTSSEQRAAGSLAAVFAFRMLGLFMVLPVLATYGGGLAGATPLLIATISSQPQARAQSSRSVHAVRPQCARCIARLPRQLKRPMATVIARARAGVGIRSPRAHRPLHS